MKQSVSIHEQLNGILDAWSCNEMIVNWFDTMSYIKSKESRNCRILEKKLKNNDIPVRYVARHSIFGINYFEVIIDDDKCGVYPRDICKILDIPEEWVGFTQHNPKIICINEDLLLEKYQDCEGILKFECDWSIKNKSYTAVERKLCDYGIDADVGIDSCGDFDFFSIRLKENYSGTDWTDIRKALNVDDVGVIEPNSHYIVKRIKSL